MLLNEEGRQHVQLLDPQRRRPLLRLLLGQVGEQARRLQEVVGLPVQLDRLDYLVLVEEVLRVLGQQARNLFSAISDRYENMDCFIKDQRITCVG